MQEKKLISENPGFSIPKNYFEDFETGILFSLTSKEEEKALELPKSEAFSIPPQYFSDFEKKILEETLHNEKKPLKVIPIHKKPYFYPMAAGIAATFLVFFQLFLKNEVNSEMNIDQVASSSIENYIEEGNIDFSASEISRFFENEKPAPAVDISQIESEQLMQYLDEHVENPALLID